MTSRFIDIYFNADMRKGHPAIQEILENDEIKIKKGQYVLFLNSRKTQFKLVCGDTKVVLHYRSSRTIDPAIIPYIPQYVNGTEFNMSKALSKRIDDYFKKRGIERLNG